MKLPKYLRLVIHLEGLSLLGLLFIAMPLKYGLQMPQATRIAGSIHGALFILSLTTLYAVALEQRWHRHRITRVLLAMLLPFGPFCFDHNLKVEASAGK